MLSDTKIDTSFLPPARTNEFLPPIGRWLPLGGLFCVSIMALAVPIASIAKYKVTVKVPATVRPIGELRIVQSATEGQILHIEAQKNQQVKQGDVIATVDDSRLQTQKSQLQTNIQQAQLQLVQIKAQISALDSQISAETNRISRGIASAQAELERRRREYRDRKITSVTETQEADANFRLAQKGWQQAQTDLQSEIANLQSAQAALKAAKSRRDRYKEIGASGAISQNQLEEAQLAFEQQEQLVAASQATVMRQKQEIDRQQQAMAAAKARWRTTQAALNPSQAEVAIAQERIAQEEAAGEAAVAVLNKEKEALIQQRIQVNQQLERDGRELQQVEVELKQTVITATADGFIAKLNLRNSHQTVRPGEEIAQIVPSNAPLVINAAVSPEHISKLESGQRVQMRVSACPYPDYGTLQGEVSQIGEDTVKPDGGAGGKQEPFYEVVIEPESRSFGRQKQCEIQPGMQGRADIVSREESVLRFVLRKARLIADL